MFNELHSSKPQPFNYQIRKSGSYSFQNYNLEELIGILKNDKKWKKGEMNMMILRKNIATKIILVVLHEKTEIKSIQVNESATFQVIEGELKLHFKKETVTLFPGEILSLHDKSRYKIDAEVETALLITLVT